MTHHRAPPPETILPNSPRRTKNEEAHVPRDRDDADDQFRRLSLWLASFVVPARRLLLPLLRLVRLQQLRQQLLVGRRHLRRHHARPRGGSHDNPVVSLPVIQSGTEHLPTQR